MTPAEISDRVKQTADARLDQVIERLFPLVRCQHAHKAWEGLCDCGYCVFIRHHYVPFKLMVHKLKKRVRYMEWCCQDSDIALLGKKEAELGLQQLKLMEIKQKKKALKEGKELTFSEIAL